ncbi:MAG: S26 family signal peptidase [Muribaculaceae bacterium]|nr:S26 family signal peptidase [Muribaculaceae bacterium]
MEQSLFNKNDFALMPKTNGKSMRPLLWGGQHCVVVVRLDGEPEVGDLLVFRQTLGDGSAKNVVHRLLEVRQEDGRHVYVTRGDNCLASERVSRDEIVGRVAEVHRMSGFRPWHAIPSRQFAVTDRAYRLYSRLWAATWPARRLYYLMRAHARGLRVRLHKLLKPDRRSN